MFKFDVSCQKCKYTCPATIPHISRLFSLLFYIIPKPVKEALDKGDKDFIKKENDGATRSFFDTSYIRFECFTCLSSLITAVHELPIRMRRLHINIKDLELMPLSMFQNIDLYKTYDYKTKQMISTYPGQIYNFEKSMKSHIDFKQNISNQIGPIRCFSKYFSSYLGIYFMPSDMALGNTNKKIKSIFHIDPFNLSTFEKFTGYKYNLHFDKCKRMVKNEKCGKTGHMVNKTPTDDIRLCFNCKLYFSNNLYVQNKRINSYFTRSDGSSVF